MSASYRRGGSSEAVITVEDNGPGIPPENYEDAFRPFSRLDASRNQNVSGVGLGLTIARDTARAHGGDVTLGKSELGGLRATIRLPLDCRNARRARKKTRTTNPSSPPLAPVPPRACTAASTALRIRSGIPPRAISTSSAAAVVPPGDVTALRSSAGDSREFAKQRAGANHRLARQRIRGRLAQPGRAPGSRQRLDQQEHIRRTRARHGRHRIHLTFRQRPDHQPERLEQLARRHAFRIAARIRQRKRRGAHADCAGRVRHRARNLLAAQRLTKSARS